MMKYVSVAEMQAIEREANASGLSYERMMENAGRGLAEVVLDDYGYLAEGGALGLVGSGNNGGDTLVALAHLAEEGWNASAAILRPRLQNDPLVVRLQAAGGRVIWLDTLFDSALLEQLLGSHDLLLDGVLRATWWIEREGKTTAVLAIRPHRKLTRGERHEVEAEAERMVEFAVGDANARGVRFEDAVG